MIRTVMMQHGFLYTITNLHQFKPTMFKILVVMYFLLRMWQAGNDETGIRMNFGGVHIMLHSLTSDLVRSRSWFWCGGNLNDKTTTFLLFTLCVMGTPDYWGINSAYVCRSGISTDLVLWGMLYLRFIMLNLS